MHWIALAISFAFIMCLGRHEVDPNCTYTACGLVKTCDKPSACVQAEAQCYIGSSDCPDYLRKAEKRLGEEIERVVNYLDPSSEAHITKVVENELIGKQVCFTHSVQPCFRPVFV